MTISAKAKAAHPAATQSASSSNRMRDPMVIVPIQQQISPARNLISMGFNSASCNLQYA